MNKNTILAIAAGAVACAGLAINVVFDRDNIYDMTLVVLWVAALALTFPSAAFSRKVSQASLAR
ncbi:MAG: hypothetical protein KGI25_02825 [Thaumarchaeota archaeon]|nr:hypothetical protein [Nitrososphaerota archaeon]